MLQITGFPQTSGKIPTTTQASDGNLCSMLFIQMSALKDPSLLKGATLLGSRPHRELNRHQNPELASRQLMVAAFPAEEIKGRGASCWQRRPWLAEKQSSLLSPWRKVGLTLALSLCEIGGLPPGNGIIAYRASPSDSWV